MRKFLIGLALLCLTCLAVSTSASATPVTGIWVSEYGMSAKLRSTYNYAYCSGLRRYGTHSLNTAQWGWVPGYFEFDCFYNTDSKSCYGGRFESDAGTRGSAWFVRMLSPGRCYAL
jgi:hypothetical protein